MPRYFFQVSGAAPYVDRDGVELADDDAAWSTAIVSLGELLNDLDGKMPDRAEIVTKVTNADGQDLITLTFTGVKHGLVGAAS